MNIRILYFAALREALGCGEESLTLPAGVGSVGALREHLAARGEPWQHLANMKNLRAAVNQTMATPETAVAEGDEIAFFPPVTGG